MPARFKNLPSQRYLLELFTYNPETGELISKLGYKQRRKGNYYQIQTTVKDDVFHNVFPVHRIIWKMQTGCEPKQIDHINGNGLDNRWCNLRSVLARENARNRRLQSNNTSGYIGVSKISDTLKVVHDPNDKIIANYKWVSSVKVDGKDFKLGTYDCPTKAYMVRLRFLNEHFPGVFHENHGRVPNRYKNP